MLSKRRQNKLRKNGRSKRGGFLWLFNKNKQQDYNKVMPADECNPNNLTQLRSTQELHAQYQKCCPKTWYGTKNSSPYCKQIDLNFQGLQTGRNNMNEYHGYSPEEVYNMRNQPSNFRGGKKTQRRKSNKNKSRRSRK